jgi:hypothetical protein
MLNSWEYRAEAIIEADDFQDRYDRNGLNFLFYWKAKYPNFKITLFTIPDRTSETLRRFLNYDWIEFAVHGWHHESVFECYDWDYEKATAYLERLERVGEKSYQKIFKAPGWVIAPNYGGYLCHPSALLVKDGQAIYKALRDRGYIIFDRHANAGLRPPDCKIVCADCNPKIVHMHTWDQPVAGQERNGFGQVQEEHGVPWDDKTQFSLVGEAWERGLFTPCSYG